MASTYCPTGIDCIWQQSCPAAVLPCPAGWLCGTYANSPYVDELDFQYARESQSKSGVDVTQANKLQYIQKGRYIQSNCMAGYYCSNSLAIDQCGAGNWCSEATIQPRTCDPMSVCSKGNAIFQVNFINFVIALVLCAVVAAASFSDSLRQRARERASRQLSHKVPTRDGWSLDACRFFLERRCH